MNQRDTMSYKEISGEYRLFARVMLLYPVRELRNISSGRVSCELMNVSYLNPALLESSGYSVIIKNKITSLKNYHQDIRFLITQNDIVLLTSLLNKKGYKNPTEMIINIFSKASRGMSVISNKNIPAFFSMENMQDSYNVGNPEKFLMMSYNIRIEGYPEISLCQVVHEAVFEEFKKTFLEGVNLNLPFINIINLFSHPLREIMKDRENFILYPEKIEILNHIEINADMEKNVFKISYDDDAVLLCYLIVGNIYSDETRNVVSNLMINNLSRFIYNLEILENAVLPVESAVSVNLSLKNLVSIKYIFRSEEYGHTQVELILTPDMIGSMIRKIFPEKRINMNINNMKEYLGLLDNSIKAYWGKYISDFKLPDKKTLRLEAEDDEIKPEKKDMKKIIDSVDEIVSIEDRIIQLAIAKMQKREILLILKTSASGIREKILSNMSRRTREDFEAGMEVKQSYTRYELKAYSTKLIAVVNNVLNLVK